MAKRRIVRDPIHGFVSLSHYEFVQEIVDTPYFQRLRRLYQLGVSVYVYPSATHNRLSHSLGAMELFVKLFDNLNRNSPVKKSEREELRKLGVAAVLLHDIGHGPLSHVSEPIFDLKHETVTEQIILRTEIKGILENHGIKARDVAEIISRIPKQKHKLVTQFVSSQLDVDRLDYLVRDTYFTGVGFSGIDLERIVQMMKIYKSKGSELDGYAVTMNRGVYSLESYILSRYLMYQGVYYHKTTRCVELLTRKIFERAKSLSLDRKLDLPDKLRFMAEGKVPTWKEICELDDSWFFNSIHEWTRSTDPVLKELSIRIMDRKLLSCIEIEEAQFKRYLEQLEKIQKVVRGFDKEVDYHLMYDDPGLVPYYPYKPRPPEDKTSVLTNIFVLDHGENAIEISELSPTVESLSKLRYSFRVYLPDKCREDVNRILQTRN